MYIYTYIELICKWLLQWVPTSILTMAPKAKGKHPTIDGVAKDLH